MRGRAPASLFTVAPVTLLLIFICGGLYALMLFSAHKVDDESGNSLSTGFSSAVLLHFGASNPETVWDGGWHRFVLPVFLHVGLLHLLCNMFSLYMLGPGAEVHFGHSNFTIIYLLSGLGGVCCSLLSGPHTTAGASGALFGLMGAWLAVRLMACWDFRRAFKSAEVREVAFYIAVNFAVTLWMPNVSHSGHLGGLLIGFGAGCLFEYWRKHQRIGWVLAFVALALPAAGIAVCRWTVFSPHYHVHLGIRAEQAGDEAAAARHFATAAERARWYRSEGAAMELARAYHQAYRDRRFGHCARYAEVFDQVAPDAWRQPERETTEWPDGDRT